VRREYAPLIDLALGERAQRFLVRDPHLLAQALRQRREPFSGRVSFLLLTPPGPAKAVRDALREEGVHLVPPHAPVAPDGVPPHPGVIALAEQVVRCDDPQLAGLPARLLGRTLIVRDLTVARAIVRHNRGYRCVTLQGELLEA